MLPEEQAVSPGAEARPEPVPSLDPEEEARIRRPPPNVGTLGRGRIYTQKAESEPPPRAIESEPEAPAPPAKAPKRRKRVWPFLLLLVLAGGTGGVLYGVKGRLFGARTPKKVPKNKQAPVAESVLAEIPAAATLFNTGPFDEQRLGEAYFAPDGKRYAFLYREGGAYGLAGAGRKKTPNNLEINGRKIHIGAVTGSEADRRRLGYFERTDRFWYLKRVGEQHQLILEDDESELYDEIGEPTEAFDGKEIGHSARLGDRWFVVVGNWRSAPYEKKIRGPWFSPNHDAFAYLVGGTGDRAREGQMHVVICRRSDKVCKKRSNNPSRSIEEFLSAAGERQRFFALHWFSEETKDASNENLEKLLVTRRSGTWQYAAITRATSSLENVPLGEGTVDLMELSARSGIERPHPERIVVSDDGSHVAMIVSGRTYVAGDGVVVRRNGEGEVKVAKEYVHCRYASRPFAKREWLVMSPDHSKIGYCVNEPAVGERISVNEHRLAPFAFVTSPPVFSKDGETVTYFVNDKRKSWVVIDRQKQGPYDEVFGRPQFTPDERQVWFGARRGRKLLFVRVQVKPIAQPADATVEL